jgi:hypothetical protein
MPISARKMDRILVQVLGFERRMGRHQIYILRIGERQVARTLISHGAREIGDDLMATMARQMGMTLSQLKKIIAGKIDREEYYRLLEEQGCIE